MTQKFRLYQRGSNGRYYIEDNDTGKQESLGTSEKAEALRLMSVRPIAQRDSQNEWKSLASAAERSRRHSLHPFAFLPLNLGGTRSRCWIPGAIRARGSRARQRRDSSGLRPERPSRLATVGGIRAANKRTATTRGLTREPHHVAENHAQWRVGLFVGKNFRLTAPVACQAIFSFYGAARSTPRQRAQPSGLHSLFWI
ncbi:MAG: hypothetical protein ABIV39_18465 [Verrucomicrobiota bacterium]